MLPSSSEGKKPRPPLGGRKAVLRGKRSGSGRTSAPKFELSATEWRWLHEVGVQFSTTKKLADLLPAVLAAALHVHGATKGLIAIPLEGAVNTLRPGATAGLSEGFLGALARIPSGAGATGHAFKRRERVIIADVTKDAGMSAYRDVAVAAGIRAVHSTPLRTGSGAVAGVLTIYFEQSRAPSARELQLIDQFSGQAAALIEAAQEREHRLPERAESRPPETRSGAFDARYGELLPHLPAALYTCDLDGRIVMYNDAAAALWGRRPATGTDDGSGGARLFRRDGTPVGPAEIPSAVPGGQEPRGVEGEIIVEREDGSRRRVLPFPQPLRDARGEIVGAVNLLFDVTDRQDSYAALRTSEERLRLATRTGKLGTWEWDLRANRVTWSESLYPIHGVAPGQFDGTLEGFRALVHPDDIARVGASIEKALANEEPYEIEFRAIRPDGTIVWLFTNAMVVCEAGQPVFMLGATMDVTDRHRAAEAERMAGALPMENPAPVLRCDRERRIGFANPAAEPLLRGWGVRLGDVAPAELQDLMQSGPRRTVPASFGARDYLLTIVPAADTGHVTFYFSDITELKSAEAAVRASEQRFARFMQHLPGLAWIKDEQGRYVFANEAAMRIFGVAPERLLGRTDMEVFSPETAALFRHNDQLALASEAGVQTIETLRHHDGALHHSIVSKFPIPAAAGRGSSIGGIAIDITARREAEKKLQEAHDRLEQRVKERTAELAQANARFQAMFDQGLFAGLIALDGTLVDVNRSWLQASGFTRDDVLGRRFWETGWWNQSADVQAWIKIGFAEALQGERFHGETIYHTADGSARRMNFALMPIRHGNGEISFIVPTGLDITDRHRAEQELQAAEVRRESEVRFRHMADHAPVLIWMTDTRNAGTWFNQQWLGFVGRSLELELGTGWLENVHAEDVDRCSRTCREAFTARRPFEMEFRLRRHDGEYRWVLDHGVPSFSAEGTFTGFISSCIDITERKEADLTQRQLAAIVESSGDAILGMDLAGVITSWNRGAERLYGHTAAKAVGQPVSLIVPPERRGEAPAMLRRLQKGERIEHFETQRLRRDGSRVDVSISMSPIHDATGHIIGMSKIARDTTDRKRAEAELRQREQFYRAIGESIDYGVWVCDAQGRNTYASECFLRLLGLRQEECKDLEWTKVLHPDDAAGTNAAWLECVRTGGAWEREHRYLGVDGQWHPILARGVPVRDEHGVVTGWVGINLDISRLKANEEALRQQTRNLAILNRVGGTLAAELDLDKVVQVVTDAGREVSGAAFGAFVHDAGEQGSKARFALYSISGVLPASFRAIGEHWDSPLFGPTFRGERVVRLAEADKSGDARGLAGVRSYLAVPVVSRSGAVHGGLFFGHPAPNVFTPEAEHLLQAMAAQAAIAIDNAQLYRDVQRELTEHLRAEQALRESEERFRTLADNIAQFAWTADEHGRIGWFNQRWFEYTGLRSGAPEEEWMQAHHPQHRQRVTEKYQEQIRRGEVWEDTFPLRSRDGTYRWFLSRAVPIRDGAGRVLRWFGTNTDVTAQREVEFALERARDEALAASRAKDDFLAALSHELRTPLNPVLLLASDAAENPALPEEIRADFDTIRKNVSLEARLIDDLLDLTRITHGKLQLELTLVDVHQLLHDALATVRAEVMQKSLDLTLRLLADQPIVRGDAVRLQQVFWNILKNAVKFTPEGGRITIGTRTIGAVRRLAVTFADTGIGMSPAELARVFDTFWQGAHAGGSGGHRFGGLGLGLAISRRVVAMHAGEIQVTSGGRDQGSSFVVELPLHTTTPEGAATVPAIPPAGGTTPVAVVREPRAVRERVLLVEDHGPTQVALVRLLQRRRFEVAAAGSLAEARALARGERFTLLISDVGLPDGSGHDLMRELGGEYGLPGIALTGFGMEEDIARSNAAGFSAHLTKPVSVRALDSAIAEILGPRT